MEIQKVDEDYVENLIISEQSEKLKIKPSKWLFVSVNLGDCKIIHVSIKNKIRVNDITGCLRSNTLDMTDPGGRLGSFDGKFQLHNFLGIF